MPESRYRVLSRRRFLELCPAAALLPVAFAGSSAGCRGQGTDSRGATPSVSGAGAAGPGVAGPSDHIAALAERFRSTPRDEVLDVAVSVVRAGATFETLLGAAFLAGVLDVRPRHVGGKLHSVMMIESAFQLAADAPAADKLRLALWSVDDFKASQQLDRDEGDWVLPSRPTVSFPNAAAALRELDAAMANWDDDRADRAIVGFVELGAQDAVFEALWPWAARCFVNIGHKIIHAAQLERTLRRMGWRHAEPVLRTIVHALLHRPSGAADLRSYTPALARVPQFSQKWLLGKDDPAQSGRLLAALRPCTIDAAQALVIDAFAGGLGPASVWDGLRLFASELFLRRRSSRPAHGVSALLPVHAVTVTEAFGHAFRTTTADTTKRLIVLQAAGWLVSIRDHLADTGLVSIGAPGLDALGAGSGAADVDAVLAVPTPERARGLVERRPQQIAALRRALLGLVAHKGQEHHQHKYAAAMPSGCTRGGCRASWRPPCPTCRCPRMGRPTWGSASTGGCRRRGCCRKGGRRTHEHRRAADEHHILLHAHVERDARPLGPGRGGRALRQGEGEPCRGRPQKA